MSTWTIKCTTCRKETYPYNIDHLVKHHLDEQGWFRCSHCHNRGYIEKRYKLQEPDVGQWEPYLHGVIQPKGWDKNNTYQPFAFLVSGSPEEHPTSVWFCYYKDTRSQGGRLKMGHGPGGPPVFKAKEVQDLVLQLSNLECLR